MRQTERKEEGNWKDSARLTNEESTDGIKKKERLNMANNIPTPALKSNFRYKVFVVSMI